MPADPTRMHSAGSSSKGSESDDAALNSSSGTSNMKERTDIEVFDRQSLFVLPNADGTPAKVLTMDEVLDVVKNMQNMALVHEIVLNPEFKLTPYKPPDNSLEKIITEIMHRAFWNLLREQLSREPPCFDQAIQLLADIKECFPQIIPTSNTKMLDRINEILDATVIRQQAEQGVLNFRSYANYVIDIMAKTCAPVRDEEIKKLTELEDVVETFKGIQEMMSLMKLDMANCLLDFARPTLTVNSVEYEKLKFKQHLEYYKLGFPATEAWLRRHLAPAENGEPNPPSKIVYNAFMEMLDWDESNEFPEVLTIDKDRISKLSQRAFRLCMCATVMGICSGVPLIYRDLSLFGEKSDCRKMLAEQIMILLENVIPNKNIEEAMESIWVHVKTVMEKRFEEGKVALDPNLVTTVKTQILEQVNKKSPLRILMWRRLETYFRCALNMKSGFPPLPPGYTDYKEELESLTASLRRVFTYNYSVFGEYYVEILNNLSPNSSDSGEKAKIPVAEN